MTTDVDQSPSGRPDAFPIPSFCPACAGPTVLDGDFLFCRRKECPAKLSGAVKVWVRNLGLLHWGDSLIESMTDPDRSLVSSVADLYRLSVEDIAPCCSGMKFAQKCYDTLHGNKDLALELVVASLNIPNFGTSTASDIVSAGFDTVDKILSASLTDLVGVPNVGEKTARQIHEGIQAKRDVLIDLSTVLSIRGPTGGVLKGKTVCITGELSRPRKAVEKDVMDAGGQPKSSVGKTTSYLVTNDHLTGSSKMQAAKKHGVTVISEDQLYRLINGEPSV